MDRCCGEPRRDREPHADRLFTPANSRRRTPPSGARPAAPRSEPAGPVGLRLLRAGTSGAAGPCGRAHLSCRRAALPPRRAPPCPRRPEAAPGLGTACHCRPPLPRATPSPRARHCRRRRPRFRWRASVLGRSDPLPPLITQRNAVSLRGRLVGTRGHSYTLGYCTLVVAIEIIVEIDGSLEGDSG